MMPLAESALGGAPAHAVPDGRSSLGQELGKKPHGSQPIPISRKPLETEPHVVQRSPGSGS